MEQLAFNIFIHAFSTPVKDVLRQLIQGILPETGVLKRSPILRISN